MPNNNQYTNIQKQVPWNKEYNKDRTHKYFVKRMMDGTTYAIMSGGDLKEPIKVRVETPPNPEKRNSWRQNIKDAFLKCDKIYEDIMGGKTMIDYKTEKVLKQKPFWNLFTQPIKNFWQLVKNIK